VDDRQIYCLRDHIWISYTPDDGLIDSGFLKIFEDSRGDIWLGTHGGINKYYPDVDNDTPNTLVDPDVNNQFVSYNSYAQVSFTGKDKWDSTEVHNLLYSYRVNRGDWSPYSRENNIIISEQLPPGWHDFEVKAMDSHWHEDPTPASWTFKVLRPWYREPGFLVLSLPGTILTLIFAYIAYQRHIHLKNSNLALQQANDELKNTQSQLIQSEKMASLGQLVAGVAHEINNPVNYIKSNLQPLRDYLSGYNRAVNYIESIQEHLPEDVRANFLKIVEQDDLEFAREDSLQLVKSLEHGSNRITKIVSDLRLYSRVDHEYYSPFDIHEALESSLTLLENKYRNRITIHRNYGKVSNIVCSPGQISQVFLNLLSNAGAGDCESREYRIRPGRSRMVLLWKLGMMAPGFLSRFNRRSLIRFSPPSSWLRHGAGTFHFLQHYQTT
jgi:hypothetical protein